MAATLAVHLLLLLALLTLSRSNDLPIPQSALDIIDVRALPPLASSHRPAIKASPKHAKPASSSKIPVSKAGGGESPIKAVPQAPAAPSFTAGAPSPTAVPEAPEIAAVERGGGSGAGNGSGSGGGTGGARGRGSGSGSSGGNDLVQPPRLISPVMSGSDFSSDQLSQWPRRGTVFLRLRVDPSGIVGECIIDRGTGVAAIDSVICNMAHERLRFRPALNRNGQNVAGWFGYAQPAPH